MTPATAAPHAPARVGSSGPDVGIEALRGTAALLVIVTHYAHFVTSAPGWWGVASTGVNLFFVLSGFVFAPYLHDTRWPVLPHLVRRAFRLYPLYLVALAVYVALKLPSPSAFEHLGAHLAMLHTMRSTEVAFFYNPAFWSLPPEVEFYLLLPLLARCVQRFGWHALFWPALALRLALSWPAADVGGDPGWRQIATVHLPGLLVEFLLGAWAWRWVTRRPPGRTAPGVALAAGLALLGATVALFAAVAVTPAQTFAARWAAGQIGLVAAAGYAGVVIAVASMHARWPRHAAAAALAAWAGHLSYGVYLLHNAAPPLVGMLWPQLGGWAAVLLCLALTLVAAWAAHLAVERPLREAGRRLSRRLAASRS